MVNLPSDLLASIAVVVSIGIKLYQVISILFLEYCLIKSSRNSIPMFLVPRYHSKWTGKSSKGTNFESPKMGRELLGLVYYTKTIPCIVWTLSGLSRVSEMFFSIRFSGLWFGYHRRLWTGPRYRCSDLDEANGAIEMDRASFKWIQVLDFDIFDSIPKPLDSLHPQIFLKVEIFQVQRFLTQIFFFATFATDRGFVWSWVRLLSFTKNPAEISRVNESPPFGPRNRQDSTIGSSAACSGAMNVKIRPGETERIDRWERWDGWSHENPEYDCHEFAA